MDNKNEIIETNQSLDTLVANSIDLIQYARQLVAKQVNLVQLMTYYSLGKWIVEVQQKGQERAQYGKKVIKALSEHLTEKFGRGFSKANLEFFRRFYLTYEDRIAETVFRQFAIEKTETVFRQLEKNPPFIVSWSHYLQLMRIENKEERSFYEIESAKSGWGIRTLQRQYNSSLYERLALSRDKDAVMRLAREGNVIVNPKDIVKIDLKVDKLTHQDIGQMQMYVNYYDRYEKIDEENPTIGILMCREANDALVEITLPKDANIYASQYKLYLPDKKLLQDKLRQWIAEEES